MKWFFALNEDAPFFGAYADMIKVAVHTAQRFTHLDPHFLYDGLPNELTAWLDRRGVTTIYRKSAFHGAFHQMTAETGKTFYRQMGPGILLRTEIPQICVERGWDDQVILYTDCDVLFTGEVIDLLPALRGVFFAVAPEEDHTNLASINTGVMAMNVEAMRSLTEPLMTFMQERVRDPRFPERAWDQDVYEVFFRHAWKSLPLELNWKPYWGKHDLARLVHFHGPKPFLRQALADAKAEPVQQRLAKGAFQHYAQIWDEALWELNRDAGRSPTA